MNNLSTINLDLPDIEDFNRFTGLSLDADVVAEVALEDAESSEDGSVNTISEGTDIEAPVRLANSRITFDELSPHRFSVGMPELGDYQEFELGLANVSLPFHVRLEKAKAILRQRDEENEAALQDLLDTLRKRFAKWSQHEDWEATLDVFDDRDFRESEFRVSVIFQRKEDGGND